MLVEFTPKTMTIFAFRGFAMKYSDYNEGKLHGTADFPIEYYYLIPEHPQYVMKPHWHNEMEIIKVHSGIFNLHLNGISYTLTKGDIIFVECGTLHSGEPEECVYECVVFDLSMLRRGKDKVSSYISPFIDGRCGLNCIIPEKSSSVYLAASSLFSVTKEAKEFYELETYNILFKIFSEAYKTGIVSYINKNPQTLKKNHTVINLLDWIEDNYAENITLKKLSEISNLSEKYICRIFKEYTSKTPIDYINELRIDSACHEMIFNRKSVTESAIICGFNDLSYFSKIFKRYKNITPQKYKKLYS